jgi:hypothetical protein
MKKLALILLSFSLFGCAAFQPKNVANSSISKNFNPEIQQRVTVLPFVVNHRDGQVDVSVTDKLSVKLIEMGFVVIERSQLEEVFKELKLNYSGAISNENIKKIGKTLSVDLLVFGSINFVPQGEINVPDVVTARFVDVETGEVVITGFCCQQNINRSRIMEIANSIQEKLGKL